MITVNEILLLHKLSIEFFGGTPGVRDLNLLESAVTRPFQAFDNKEIYASIFEKSAALLESIINNHPFIDGNKRTGLLAVFVFLRKNKIKLTASEKETYDFIIKVASSKTDFDEIVLWLQKNSIPLS